MATIAFDTLRFARKLEEPGFTREQAIGATEALGETMGDSLAAKSDAQALKTDLKAQLYTLKVDVEPQNKALRTDLEVQIIAPIMKSYR